MTSEDWKNRRSTQDVLGVNVLKKTIDDYEVKLCENHTVILNLEHDNKNLKEQLAESKKELSKEKAIGDRQYKYYTKEIKDSKVVQKASEAIIEVTKTKFFQFKARKEILKKLENFIRWGY